MAKYPTDETLDRLFHAMADPTRRAILVQLADGEASVGALASPHALALPTFLRHVTVLEDAGLLTTKKVGRQRVVTPNKQRLAEANAWIRFVQSSWESRLDRLAAFLVAQPSGDLDEP